MSTLGVPRLEALTGIRILAAVAVFMSHVGAYPGAPTFIVAFTNAGYNGVTLFFILSGFILTWNYEPVLGDKLSLAGIRSFYVARLARVYPLYLVALALVVVPTVDSVSDATERLSDPFLWSHVFSLQAWSLQTAFLFNAPGWSIGVEFFLYATFPFLLIATKALRHSNRALVILAIGAVLISTAFGVVFTFADPVASHEWLYLKPLTRLPDFLVGIALAGIVQLARDRDFSRLGRWSQVIGAASTLAIMCTPALVYSPISWDAIYIVPFAALIFGLAVAPGTTLGRVLGSRAFVFLGETSFAFYLLHYIFYLWLAPIIGTTPISYLTGAITLFAVCLFAAAGAHVLIERPARAGVRRLLDPQRKSNLTMALPLNESPAEVLPAKS